MAQSKKKTTAKKKTTKRRKTKAEIQQEEELRQWITIVILSAITIIAYTKMGMIGKFLSNLQRFLFGKLYVIVMVIIVLQIVITIINKHKEGSTRSKNPLAIILIVTAILLWCALSDTAKDMRGWEIYLDYVSDLASYFEGTGPAKVGGGLIGALLLALTTMLVDRTGTMLVIGVLLVISALLLVNLKVYKDAFHTVVEYFSTEDYEEDDGEEEEEPPLVQAVAKAKPMTPSPAAPQEVPLKLTENQLEKPSTMLKVDDTEELTITPKVQEVIPSNGIMDSLIVDDHPETSDFLSDMREEKKEDPVQKTMFLSVDDLVDRHSVPPSRPSYESSFENLNVYDEDEYDDVDAVTEEEIIPAEIPEEEVVGPMPAQEVRKPVQEPVKPAPKKVTPEEERKMRAKKYKIPNARDVHLSEKDRNNNQENVLAAQEKGELLIQVLRNFDIEATLMDTHIGPAVTKFEIKPESNIKVSRILGLADDIKMQLAVKDVRIEAPIPGHNAVGIEIPNVKSTPVKLKELIDETSGKIDDHPLTIYLGKDLFGKPVTCRLDKMPHMLIAGATGSGKSVCMNSIITSILMRTKPDAVKLLLVDPKKVEFTPYHNIPHLIGPVINDALMASNALKIIVEIMEQRYDAFSRTGVRNIQGFNDKVDKQPADAEPRLARMPYIVVIIDELADLMLVAGKEVESSIQRITQLARAAGIHLIVATQRPSTDVITGVIKANIPSRIAFAVSSGIDSRTILDHVGAERLLGYGDMLYLPIGESNAMRVQGVYVSDSEVESIANYVSQQAAPQYDDRFVTLNETNGESSGFGNNPQDVDPLYPEIRDYVIAQQKASTSLLQRRFGIGYNRAARLIDYLEQEGVIGAAKGSKPRDVLIKPGE